MVEYGKVVLGILFILVIKVVHWLLAHETIFKLSKKRRYNIKKHGLIHYTTMENANIIIQEQKLIGKRDYKSTFPSHRNDEIVWFMSNQKSLVDIFFRWCVLRRHAPKRNGKLQHKVKYETKLLISDFSDEQILNMKINIELGIGCYTNEVNNVIVSHAELDFVDRLLGVTK